MSRACGVHWLIEQVELLCSVLFCSGDDRVKLLGNVRKAKNRRKDSLPCGAVLGEPEARIGLEVQETDWGSSCRGVWGGDPPGASGGETEAGYEKSHTAVRC